MSCLRTPEPTNSPKLCGGQGSWGYRRYQILLPISHPMPRLEPMNLLIYQDCVESKGVRDIADIKYHCQYLTQCPAFEPLNLSIHHGRARGQGSRRYRRYQISHPMPRLRTPEPLNSPKLCRGQGIWGYRRYQILCPISHQMPRLRTPEPFNSSKQRQRAGESGCCCPMPTAPFLLSRAKSSMPTAWCLLPRACCPVPAAPCLLPHAYCPVPTAPCLLPRAC